MKYRRLLAPAIVVPKQEPGRPFWGSQALPEGSVVGLMKKNIPSPVTGKANEITVRWKDVAGRETLGWLAKNTPMDDKMSKKELVRGSGEIRMTGWDTVRERMMTYAPGWTAKKWVCAFAETHLPLLHAVIRELGGKVPKTDDQFAAISRSLKLITGEDITMKEAEETKKSTNLKSKKNKKGSAKKSSTKEKTSTKSKKAGKKEKSAGPGRTSEFAGKRIFRVSKENPRREGSQGWKSWNVIKKGMTYEDFIKAGGSRGSLAKEVKNKRVKLK